MKILPETNLEEIISAIPSSIEYLREKGIKCIACGEPVWGTLEYAARLKNIGKDELLRIVEDLNNMYKKNFSSSF